MAKRSLLSERPSYLYTMYSGLSGIIVWRGRCIDNWETGIIQNILYQAISQKKLQFVYYTCIYDLYFTQAILHADTKKIPPVLLMILFRAHITELR